MSVLASFGEMPVNRQVAMAALVVVVALAGCSTSGGGSQEPDPEESTTSIETPSASPAGPPSCTGQDGEACVGWSAENVLAAQLDDDQVFAITEDEVRALDTATGAVRWAVASPYPGRDVQPVGSFGAVVIVGAFGNGEVVGDVVGNGSITALSRGDGSTVWQQDVGELAFGDPSVEALVVTFGNEVRRLDPSTGDVLWSSDQAGEPSGFLGVQGALVVVPVGGVTHILHLDSGANRVTIPMADGVQYRVLGVSDATAVAVPLTDSGSSDVLVGFSMDTGDIVYEVPVVNAQSAFTADGVLVIPTIGGGGSGLDVTTGEVVWTLNAGEIFGRFGLAGVKAFLILGRGETEAIGLVDIATGDVRWQTRADADVRAWQLGDRLLGVVRSGGYTLHDAGTGDVLLEVRQDPTATFPDPSLILIDTNLISLLVP